MSTRSPPDAVLAEIPGWEGASWRELTGGLNNATYRVTQGELNGVLKIDEHERSAPFNTRLAEASVQSMAANAGLASRVLFAGECAYLTEYVDGVTWERNCLNQNDNLQVLAQALQRLHSLPLTGRSFDSVVAAKRYVANIDSSGQQLVAHCTGIVEAMRLPKNLCCCHNDLVVGNLIKTPALRFLDWEYACDNDPFFDLATIVEHHELAEQQICHLLDAYFDGHGLRWRHQLADQQTLYLALLWLWLASRPNSDPAELQRVGVRITTRRS